MKFLSIDDVKKASNIILITDFDGVWTDNNVYTNSDYSAEHYTAGYCNVTAAIDAVQFSMTSGNIDAGTITLYGIS